MRHEVHCVHDAVHLHLHFGGGVFLIVYEGESVNRSQI
jgi:hypothetical protein